ncbi:MAG: hypothetical protein KGK30_07415, partial [Elusimicrobia bacterium]|nr:hypothetical protein [Elusimicrobiota bacterium]
EGFSPQVLALFRKTNEDLKKRFKLDEVREFGLPEVERAQIYGIELPQDANLGRVVSSYNARLRKSEYHYYRFEGQEVGGRKFLFTQATALRLNAGRVAQGLFSQNPDLQDSLKREQVLVLGDTARGRRFLDALAEQEIPGKAYFVHNVENGAQLEDALGKILDKDAQQTIKVTRHQLRAYVEWRQRQVFGPRPVSDGRPGAGKRAKAPAGFGRTIRDLAFFRGIVHYNVMMRMKKLMHNHQWEEASVHAAVDLARRMWREPLQNGLRLRRSLLEARRAPEWKALEDGFLEAEIAAVENYYGRNFPGQWPTGAAERARGLANIATDGKNGIKAEYLSPVARYQVNMLPAEVHSYQGEGHWILEAHAYRSGKSMRQDEFDESIERNLLAHALLLGYAKQQPDGSWKVNDQPVRLRVIFHYGTQDYGTTDLLTPGQVVDQAAQVTTLITNMLADREFLAFWEEEQRLNRRLDAEADLKAERAKAQAQRRRRERSRRKLQPKKTK